MNNFEKKSVIVNEVSKGVRTVIIDPDKEFSLMAKQLGGKLINLDPSNVSSFNPWEGLKTSSDNSSIDEILQANGFEGGLNDFFGTFDVLTLTGEEFENWKRTDGTKNGLLELRIQK